MSFTVLKEPPAGFKASASASAATTQPSQLQFLRFLHRSGRQRLVAAGSHEAACRSHRLRDHDLCVGERPGERISACRGRAWRAREAHRAGRPELARLVRRVHGARAVWRRAAPINDEDRRHDGMRVIGRPAPAPFSALFLRSNGTGKLIIEKRKPNMWFVNGPGRDAHH